MKRIQSTPAERARWRYFAPMVICAGLWTAGSLALDYLGPWSWFVLMPALGTFYFGWRWRRAVRRWPIEPKP